MISKRWTPSLRSLLIKKGMERAILSYLSKTPAVNKLCKQRCQTFAKGRAVQYVHSYRVMSEHLATRKYRLSLRVSVEAQWLIRDLKKAGMLR
ncbi:MAG TPA: hypothetical protein DCE42_26500 [Myxococcales bacterium]|nr:hypothetical protein [Deltaproteobacteria bacterium]HAA58341.1 hypothetical protein [Myxococcales bacterium]